MRTTFDVRKLSEGLESVLSFFADRLKVALKEKGIRHDLIDAVFSLGHEDDLVRLVARVEALQAFLKIRRWRQSAGGLQARRQYPQDRGKEGRQDLHQRGQRKVAVRTGREGAVRGPDQGARRHHRRAGKGRFRRRHAADGGPARSGGCLLRGREGECRRQAGAREPAEPVGQPCAPRCIRLRIFRA